MGFIFLFSIPPCYVALWDSKTPHWSASESVSWCLETSSLLRLPSWDRSPSLCLLSLFLSFIVFVTSFRRQWSAFLGARCTLPAFRSCFVVFAQAQKFISLSCGEKVIFPSYSLRRLTTAPETWTLNSTSTASSFPFCFRPRLQMELDWMFICLFVCFKIFPLALIPATTPILSHGHFFIWIKCPTNLGTIRARTELLLKVFFSL